VYHSLFRDQGHAGGAGSVSGAQLDLVRTRRELGDLEVHLQNAVYERRRAARVISGNCLPVDQQNRFDGRKWQIAADERSISQRRGRGALPLTEQDQGVTHRSRVFRRNDGSVWKTNDGAVPGAAAVERENR